MPSYAHLIEKRIAGPDRIPSLMPQQVFDRNLFDPCILDIREHGVAQNTGFAENLVVQREFSRFVELHDARSGNQFGDGGDTKDMFHLGRDILLLVGPTEAFAV